ncbi:MAG: DUF1801 domain-containing protein [Bacteroidetes bacterium]|nr:MAG: DUF1801 domain-containing protein [Bacteroidota bacterium]
MDQKIKNYILTQPADRQSILSDIHSIILDKDKSVTSEIEPMMGKEMIIYKANGMMKYGLAGVKNYMSLHVLPIYGSKTLFEKYKSLLTRANFQKGCINFDTAEKMPLDIVRQLISDCSKVDLKKIREDQLNERKLRAKAKK